MLDAMLPFSLASRFTLPPAPKRPAGGIARRRLMMISLVFFSLLFFGSRASLASAQSIAEESSPLREGVAVIEAPLGLPTADIRLIIARVVRAALGLLGLVLIGLLLYAGYLWMTAGGNEEAIADAKRIIRNAVIGLAIILSAYAIVSYVIRLLGIGEGLPPGGAVGAPRTQNFRGSGALGSIIKDHYPERDATEVPRNTKILVTFRLPIKPDSVAVDTNRNGTFGDCINIGANMQWERDCDALKLDNDHVNITRADTGAPIRGATLLAAAENNQVFTIAIRPWEPIGSEAAPLPYQVHLGNGILRDDPAQQNPGIFTSRTVGTPYYEWRFTASTKLDDRPPTVANVWPPEGSREAKNTVLQIDFSEAMDPVGLQGEFAGRDDYFVVSGDTIFLQSGRSTVPLGLWRLTNGYRTLEFTPTRECGANACGGTIFCLPVCDAGACPGNPPEDIYRMLVRAALTFTADRFEAIPFSGAMDVAGNALDGNKDNRVNRVDRSLPLFGSRPGTQEAPDNFVWLFNLQDRIDATAPILNQITPGLDAEYVAPRAPWKIAWSKRMRIEPMYGITVTEKPSPTERGDNTPLCLTPRVWFNGNGTTDTRLEHCPFLDGIRQYYFPALTSDLEDVHFNCFYPGVGPGGRDEVAARKQISGVCDSAGANCCPVTTSTPGLDYCCNGDAQTNLASGSACLPYLQSISP